MTLRSTTSYTKLRAHSPSFRERALAAFVTVVENVIGGTFIDDTPQLLGAGLAHLEPLAQALQRAGIMRSLSRVPHVLPDEPRMYTWRAQYADDDSAGGSSATSSSQALVSTLAECLERYLWRYDAGAFIRPRIASEHEMARQRHVPLARFSGFSEEQRAKHSALRVTKETPLLWIEAKDLIIGGSIYVPAQTASAARHAMQEKREPLIRPRITTGLATGPTREFALLAGLLEIIERDAFMIMWLNQLTYPRIDPAPLSANDAELRELLVRLARYDLTADIIPLLTDAPAHAVCAVIRDTHKESRAPLIVGLGSGQYLSRAVSHAIHEALRMRVNARMSLKKIDPSSIIPAKIHHFERVPYWMHGDRHTQLRWMTQGRTIDIELSEWEKDDQMQYIKRIIAWCENASYTCVSVDLGVSKKNPTPFAVESVIIPEMQPLHIMEKHQCLGGVRLQDIPRKFGYEPRAEPFSKEPHPFA